MFVAVLISSSLPFWLLLGSVRLDGFGLLLPASALMFVCPMIAATVLAAVEGGRAQVATLWRRSVDVPAARYAGWIAAVALLPALVLLATLLDHGSVALPPAPVPPAAVPLLALVYLAAGLAEEVGWTAYLTDRVLLRLGTAGSGHCVPTAVVMHAGLNVATAALPGAGPDLDPAPVAAVLSVAAVATGLLRAWRDGRGRRHGRAGSGGRRRRSPRGRTSQVGSTDVGHQ